TSPAGALKGGLSAASQPRRLHAPIAGQIAFCALVLLIGGLFVSTFNRLSTQPTGFSPEGLLDVDTTAQPAQPPAVWRELAADLSALPGVEASAASAWALLSGSGSNGFIWRDGAPTTNTRTAFLGVTPGWFRVMRIPFIGGRDFRETDPMPGT